MVLTYITGTAVVIFGWSAGLSVTPIATQPSTQPVDLRQMDMIDMVSSVHSRTQPKECHMKKVLIVLFALAIVSPVLAQEDPSGGPPPIAVAAHHQVVEFLELTPEQVEAWNEMYLIHREGEQVTREEIRILEAELMDLMDAGDPDPAAVGELVLQIADLRAQVREIHTIYHEGFLALLDDDQTGRLRFIARADRVQLIIPAFKLFELIPRR